MASLLSSCFHRSAARRPRLGPWSPVPIIGHKQPIPTYAETNARSLPQNWHKKEQTTAFITKFIRNTTKPEPKHNLHEAITKTFISCFKTSNIISIAISPSLFQITLQIAVETQKIYSKNRIKHNRKYVSKCLNTVNKTRIRQTVPKLRSSCRAPLMLCKFTRT